MCREACGGAGYLQENRLPHLKADTDVFTTFEGDNTVLLQLVAKGLLTGYRDAFGSLEGWGKVGFIADMVRETVLERTAARALIARLVDAVGRDDEAPDARPRLAAEDDGVPREARARGRDPAAAQELDDRGHGAVRHVQRRPGPRAEDGADAHRPRRPGGVRGRRRPRPSDADAKALLDKVCDLYALSTIEADKAWFLEHGRLTASRAKLLTSTVNQLLKELRPHIITLVDAFAIPADWKAAKILEEEDDRQEAMAARDAEVRAEAEGRQAPEESATDLEVAPAQ